MGPTVITEVMTLSVTQKRPTDTSSNFRVMWYVQISANCK